MLNLDYNNVLISSLLNDRIQGQATSAIDQAASDFDGVMFHISTPESKDKIMISMQMRCFPDLVNFGAKELLQREYGDLVVESEENYDFSVLVDMNNLPSSDEEVEELVKKLSLMKRNALAAPFEKAFEIQNRLAEEAQSNPDRVSPGTEIMAVHYREEEAFYVIPSADRVTVIFSTVFREETDRIFGKVFLQEFVDARRRPAIQNAPQVKFTYRDPPLELKSENLKPSDDIGYVTFTMFPRHYTREHREECISHIQVFRNTLHYHIKASKAYMHQRMRARVSEFLKVLNRAKPENTERERKTASGRTFTARR